MADGPTLLLWFHIGSMMLAFAALPVAGTIVRVVVRRVDEPRVMQMLITAFRPINTVGGVSVGLGVAFGLLLARPFGYGSGWLMLAYVLSTLAALIGIVIDEPWARRLASADAQKLPLVRNALVPRLAVPVGGILWFSILWLMIAKPSL